MAKSIFKRDIIKRWDDITNKLETKTGYTASYDGSVLIIDKGKTQDFFETKILDKAIKYIEIEYLSAGER